MVVQIGADISEPLDSSAPATLHFEPLAPQYSLAALNLSIDHYRQIQSLLTKKVFWHPISLGTLVAINSWPIYHAAKSRGIEMDFFEDWQLLFSDAGVMAQLLAFFMASFASVLLLAKVLSFGAGAAEKGDEIQRGAGEVVFGINLRQFMQTDVDVKNSRKNNRKLSTQQEEALELASKNSRVVIYRGVPIAVVSVQEVSTLPEAEEENKKGNKDVVHESRQQQHLKITALGARKVYLKTGIFDDLVSWAIQFAEAQVVATSAVDGSEKKPAVSLDVECFSVDKPLLNALRSSNQTGQKAWKVANVKKEGILGSVFGVKVLTYRLDIEGKEGKLAT